MSASPWDILSARVTRISDTIKNMPKLRQATLHSTTPLQVVFDTDTSPTIAYASLTSSLTPGDRVLVANVGKYYWIIGVKGGANDTGWVDLPIASPFAIYGTSGYLRYRKVGNTVQLIGRLTCNTAGHIEGVTYRLMGTLPAGVRPTVELEQACQGSSTATWHLTIRSNGEITAARYSATQNKGVWLPFTVTWTV